jgi:NAD(P)-dependent dehydrogenase (short-subunit alcohol dehydrogenase family)
VRAFVTGGRGGIGSAIVAALGDADVVALDLPDFDVGDTAAWRSLEGPFDAAFLNAGVTTGESDIAALSDERYRRAVAANVDGVVYGVRECAARLMPDGGAIVCTASLSGLVATPADPVYGLTKHAVIGIVRSVAPQLHARGIRISAICPGFTDTPMVVPELRGAIDVPLIDRAFVAEAALRAMRGQDTGDAWVVQPNRIEKFHFPGVPGPR